MPQPSIAELRTIIEQLIDPYRDIALAQVVLIKNIHWSGETLELKLVTSYPAKGASQSFEVLIRKALAKVGVQAVILEIEIKIQRQAIARHLEPIAAIKNIIAIASGKGGVGKSSVAINLALAIQAEGARVGLLDADIYGPSQPHMLAAGLAESAEVSKDLKPRLAFGLQTMSIGYLVAKNAGVLWRGPMVSSALTQLLQQTEWQDLDYLIVDLPPGTGDIQLTLTQKLPLTAALMVTTPQEIAVIDARRAMALFHKLHIPVLGIIENMSGHVCSHCHHREALFGEGGGQSMAEEYKIPLLGQLPLDRSIQELLDAGKPPLAVDPESANSLLYRELARRVTSTLAGLPREYRVPGAKMRLQD